MKSGRQGFVTRGGLAYRTFTSRGAPTGPTFVLLHGIGMSHRYLNKLHRELAPHGSVVSFDLPGFAGTPKPGRAVAVEEYADMVAHTLRRAGVASCVVVGHSMGCQFAIELARQHSSLVSHAVLIGPVVDERRRTLLRQAAALIADILIEPFRTNVIAAWDYLRCGPRWFLTELHEMMRHPSEERIADVDAPVLVVRGARDPVAGRVWTAVLTARAPRGRMLEIPANGHMVQHTAPTAVAEAIRAFAHDPLTVGGAP